jgi:hypothetical protein
LHAEAGSGGLLTPGTAVREHRPHGGQGLADALAQASGGVQAAALLIAAKRADAIASEIAVHTEKNTEELKNLIVENTDLTKQVKANTDLLEDIHRHVTALGASSTAPPDAGDGN